MWGEAELAFAYASSWPDEKSQPLCRVRLAGSCSASRRQVGGICFGVGAFPDFLLFAISTANSLVRIDLDDVAHHGVTR